MIPVKIKNGRYKVSNCKQELWWKFGLNYDNDDDSCQGTLLTNFRVNKLKLFCAKKKLRFEINNDFGKRSNNYRIDFFNHSKPILGDKYFCSYCGKILSHKTLVVDHLYPIDKVNQSVYLQKKLKSMGANSVNHYKNLVPACNVCNAKKSAKMGLWIIRGKIGKYPIVWKLIWGIRILLLTIIGLYIYSNWQTIKNVLYQLYSIFAPFF